MGNFTLERKIVTGKMDGLQMKINRKIDEEADVRDGGEQVSESAAYNCTLGQNYKRNEYYPFTNYPFIEVC